MCKYIKIWFLKVFLIIGLIGTISPKTLLSQNLIPEKARSVATDFLSYREYGYKNLQGSLLPEKIQVAYQSDKSAEKPVFVFQKESGGFVILSQQGWDQYEIVGYADDGIFDHNNIPPQLMELLKYYEDSLVVNEAKELRNVKESTPIVYPLLDQESIWLDQFAHNQVGNCPTGCVATAVAQIMKYHAVSQGTPITGKGSYCYTDGSFGEICADFDGIQYDSDELLSFHVGVSMEMQYCGSPYGSIPNRGFAYGLKEHFSYYTLNSIEDDFYVKNELENQRPLYIAIYGDPVGHAVVLDGYDDRGYYHVNFGWGGYFNGYYWLNSNKMISPGGVLRFSTNISQINAIIPYVIPVNEQDSLALLAMHNAMGGYSATGWDISQPVMTWNGVYIMNDRVIELLINSQSPPNTAQSIAPEIGDLSALRKLYLSGPFNGNIPSSISQLTELRELHLYNTYFYDAGSETLYTGNLSGQLPADIGNLSNLEWLSIYNALEGTIPFSIGNLHNLKLLRIYQDTTYFDQGNLHGEIPAEISNLTQLQQLHISNQRLSGSLPASLTNMTQLHDIYLSGNQLSGEIPVFNLPNLQFLNLSANSFSSVAEGAANCPMLKDIQWQDNLIEGAFPAYFDNFPELLFLNLANNKIESFPDELGKLSKLQGINLDNNELTALPDGIAILYNLKNLSAVNNHISQVPSNLGQSHNLITLNLSYNEITEIPEELGNCPNLWEIVLNDNKITSIPESFGNLRDGVMVYLHNNEIQGSIPEELILASEGNNKFVTLGGNRFVYSDIPESDNIGFSVRNQKPVALTKKVFKVQLGDTINLDICSISNLSHIDNDYFWLPYPQLTEVMFNDERFDGVENNPVLQLIINENNINNQYYCKVFNPSTPTFHFDYQGSLVEGSCLEYLNTDTISFQLATDEEILADQYEDEFVTSLASLGGNAISDGTVTLVPPIKVKRGEVYWEASVDGDSWARVSDDMVDAGLKANVKSISSDELILNPVNDAWYRCVIAETDCAPMYSQPLKVEAPGVMLYDEIINVTEEPLVASVDSIEVIIPQHFYDEDFRLTITKLDNPPAAPDSVIAFSAYDVSVDIDGPFSLPLMVRFKNTDKSMVNEMDIDKYKAVWYDDLDREWKHFEHSHLSMQDSTLTLLTDHLTKLSIWFDPDAKWGYTDVYERNNIKVFYKDDDVPLMTYNYGKNQSPQPWHVDGYPELVQDVTEFLSQVMTKYQSLGLPLPDGKFSVYVKQMDNAGVVGWQGLTFGYVMIDAQILKPEELMTVLAHEYMHYTQDYYISAHVGNSFWMEAHATLSDRIVWNDDDIPFAESEETLLSGRTWRNHTFNYLADSWDASDRGFFTNNMLAQLQHQYLAGTFLHYMRSYRADDKKLEPAALLRETPWTGGWRLYLGNFVSSHLGGILGDEYEEYVKYIHSGENEKFTIINAEGNPFAYLQDPKNKNIYTHPVSYRIKPGDNPIQTNEFSISVPYMASKVVLLENLNPDTMLLVNYKRNHEFSYNDMVYYVTWDHKKKKMEFLDISDSTEFNFLLDARTRENQKTEFRNYGYILLLNKRYIGVSSLMDDFDASFEITAMPLLNVERTAMLNIYNGDSPITHTFQSGSSGSTASEYIFMGNPSALFMQNSTHMTSYEVKGATVKEVISGQTYQVRSSYSLIFDEGIVTGVPTMKDSTVYSQTFEHDIITGNLKIIEQEKKYYFLNKFVEYYEVSPGHYEERLIYSTYLARIEEKTKTYWLKDVFSYMQPPDQPTGWEDVYGSNLILFETANTSQTQQVVDEIDASCRISYFDQSGNLASTEEWNYEDTNFSPAGLKLLFILKISEE
jgi:Leucine-rich repeat (LRR) protein